MSDFGSELGASAAFAGKVVQSSLSLFVTRALDSEMSRRTAMCEYAANCDSPKQDLLVRTEGLHGDVYSGKQRG